MKVLRIEFEKFSKEFKDYSDLKLVEDSSAPHLSFKDRYGRINTYNWEKIVSYHEEET